VDQAAIATDDDLLLLLLPLSILGVDRKNG
jgi:hypothetical protein